MERIQIRINDPNRRRRTLGKAKVQEGVPSGEVEELGPKVIELVSGEIIEIPPRSGL